MVDRGDKLSNVTLEQLVPRFCEHPPARQVQSGVAFFDTGLACTEEVLGRVKRIPIPFVREMVIQRVAENAHQAGVECVDLEFYEKASTF